MQFTAATSSALSVEFNLKSGAPLVSENVLVVDVPRDIYRRESPFYMEDVRDIRASNFTDVPLNSLKKTAY